MSIGALAPKGPQSVLEDLLSCRRLRRPRDLDLDLLFLLLSWLLPLLLCVLLSLLLLSLLTTCDALRFPTARTVSQRVVSSLTPVPPSPFALSECFSPAAFSPPRTAQAQVTCVWEGVETQAVEALLKLCLLYTSPSPRDA